MFLRVRSFRRSTQEWTGLEITLKGPFFFPLYLGLSKKNFFAHHFCLREPVHKRGQSVVVEALFPKSGKVRAAFSCIRPHSCIGVVCAY